MTHHLEHFLLESRGETRGAGRGDQRPIGIVVRFVRRDRDVVRILHSRVIAHEDVKAQRPASDLLDSLRLVVPLHSLDFNPIEETVALEGNEPKP